MEIAVRKRAFATTSTIVVSNINLYTTFTRRSRMRMISATFATVLAFGLSFGGAHAQSEKSGVEKLYILSCGEGVAGDISLWSPGVDEGKSMNFVDNC